MRGVHYDGVQFSFVFVQLLAGWHHLLTTNDESVAWAMSSTQPTGFEAKVFATNLNLMAFTFKRLRRFIDEGSGPQ